MIQQALSKVNIMKVSRYFSLLCKTNRGNAAAAAKSLQSRPTLCDPIDGSPPGSPVPGAIV